jgi:hypothetical protein
MGIDLLVGHDAAVEEKPDVRRSWPMLAFVATAACLALASAALTKMPDDAWIYFRYADHLVDGHGWRYNLTGTTANAATSPLHAMMLAGIHAVGLPLQAAGRALTAAGLWTAMITGGQVFRRLGRPAAAWVFVGTLAVFPLGPMPGMETATYMALLMAAVLLYERRSGTSLGCVLGILPAVRPEAAVVSAVFVAVLWLRDRQVPWRTIVVGASVGAGWLLLQAAVVGQLLPTTGGAKIAQGQSGIWPGFLEGMWDALLRHRPLWGMTVTMAAGAGALTSRGRERTAWGLLAAVAVTVTAGMEIAGAAYYGWYAAPVVVALLFAAAWFGGASWLHAMMVGGAIVATSFVPPGWSYDQPLDDYRRAAEWVAANGDPDVAVSATEIGVVGFYSERCVIDYLGLLDPSASAQVARADFGWWANHYQPDYVVTSPLQVFEQTALQQADGGYRQVFRSGNVAVLKRTADAAGREGLCRIVPSWDVPAAEPEAARPDHVR